MNLLRVFAIMMEKGLLTFLQIMVCIMTIYMVPLKEKIIERISNGLFKGWVSISHQASATRAKLYEEGCVRDEVIKDKEWHLKLNIGNDLLTDYLNSSKLKILHDENQQSLEVGEPGRT